MNKKILVGAVTLGLVLVIILAGCSRARPTQPAPASPPATPQATSSPVPATPAPPQPAPAIVPPTTVTPPPVPQPVVPPVSPPPAVIQAGLPLTISQPADGSTLSPSVTVKGKTKAGATVSVNDELITADSQGNFSIPLSLESGPNAIDVIATDSAGNQAEALLMVNVDSSLTSSTPVPAQPVPNPVLPGILPLKVTQPIDGATINSDSVVVKGQAGSGATVSVNDEVVTADDQGNFSVSVSLQPGPNAIDVVAIDEDGNENEFLIIVNAAG